MVSNSAQIDRRTKQHTEFGVSASNGSRDMGRTKSWRKKKEKRREKKREKNERRQSHIASPTGIANEGKTEIITVKGNLRNDLRADFGMLHFENTQLVPCECAKNLLVVLDSTLSFRPRIDSVVKTCNFHIRNLYMIRNFINRDNLLSLVHSLIASKIDYCNSLLVGLPKLP